MRPGIVPVAGLCWCLFGVRLFILHSPVLQGERKRGGMGDFQSEPLTPYSADADLHHTCKEYSGEVKEIDTGMLYYTK